MGCDIHCWLEHREADDAPWQIQRRSPCECQTEPGDCWRCDDRRTIAGEPKKEEKGWQVMRPAIADYDGEGELWADGDCYHSRNYSLFMILAGVRSRLDDFEPVFEPRGIPADASPEFKAMAGWVGDGEDEKVTDWHSHSYLDLVDIYAAFACSFDMSQTEEIEQVRANTSLFWRHVVELQMRPIAARVGPHNVRIVFFFDN